METILYVFLRPAAVVPDEGVRSSQRMAAIASGMRLPLLRQAASGIRLLTLRRKRHRFRRAGATIPQVASANRFRRAATLLRRAASGIRQLSLWRMAALASGVLSPMLHHALNPHQGKPFLAG
ncbi:hypothetical protein [Paenibacillus chitinolyticus]